MKILDQIFSCATQTKYALLTVWTYLGFLWKLVANITFEDFNNLLTFLRFISKTKMLVRNRHGFWMTFAQLPDPKLVFYTNFIVAFLCALPVKEVKIRLVRFCFEKFKFTVKLTNLQISRFYRIFVQFLLIFWTLKSIMSKQLSGFHWWICFFASVAFKFNFFYFVYYNWARWFNFRTFFSTKRATFVH